MTRFLTYRTFILLFLFGFLQFETRASADTSAEVPPGKLVDVGGRKLHLYCTGKGSPTVILESGAGSFAIDWALVQPEVAKDNTRLLLRSCRLRLE